MNICDKISSHYTEVVCSDDFYQSTGKSVKHLTEKEKKMYLEILKSEITNTKLITS
jgi:uridine phosphorylase